MYSKHTFLLPIVKLYIDMIFNDITHGISGINKFRKHDIEVKKFEFWQALLSPKSFILGDSFHMKTFVCPYNKVTPWQV